MPEYVKAPGNPKMMDAFESWFKAHGQTGVFVKTTAGGRIFLANGETAPFMTTTINQFVETGRAERKGNRVTLCKSQ